MDIHKIEITKKHNINKVFHLNLQRDITKDVKDSDITHFKQINYLNKHYLNQNIDDKVLEKLFITELKKKLSQYKNQDKTKIIFDKNNFITYDDIIEKRQEQVANENNFEITDHSLYIYGICEQCKN